MNWSGGKESALSLHLIRQSPEYEVSRLLTVVNEPDDRVPLHGVPSSLLHRQALALDLPLELVRLPRKAPNDLYIRRLEPVLAHHMERGVRSAVFGDGHQQDIREWRERLLARIGMRGLFPLWKINPETCLKWFFEWGYRAVVVSVDTRRLDAGLLGRSFDQAFLDDLPSGVDRCGEQGEYHTFVYDGPLFRHPIAWRAAGTGRDGDYLFVDLTPVEQEESER